MRVRSFVLIVCIALLTIRESRARSATTFTPTTAACMSRAAADEVACTAASTLAIC